MKIFKVDFTILAKQIRKPSLILVIAFLFSCGQSRIEKFGLPLNLEPVAPIPAPPAIPITAPVAVAAQNLMWDATTVSYSLTPVTSWTLATNATIVSQEIQYFSDGVCLIPHGGPVSLSAATTSHNFSGTDGSTYSFRISSLTSTGTTLQSSCSPSLTLDLNACVGARLTNTPYADGAGTALSPFLICTATQMNAIGAASTDWNKQFKLLRSVSLSAFTGNQYNVIGKTTSIAFTGTFDGNNQLISDFTYNDNSTDEIGLFGYVSTGATIKNLSLSNVSLRASNSSVLMGGFVGLMMGGTLQNLNLVSGQIVQTNTIVSQDMGGIVGQALNATLTNLKSSVTISALSQGNRFGGVVGYLRNSTASQLQFDGTFVTGTSLLYAGGVAGVVSNSTIDQSFSTSDIYSAVGQYGGGLIGSMVGTSNVTRSYATGGVNFNGFGVGGLVGALSTNSTYGISNCYATGAVSGGQSLGGLVGEVISGAPKIQNVYATGLVSTSPTKKGGLIGTDNNGGVNRGVYTATFWNNQVNPTLTAVGSGPTPAGSTAANTATMQLPATFSASGWTSPTWNLTTSGSFLKLGWQP